jgi:hypothetical protein
LHKLAQLTASCKLVQGYLDLVAQAGIQFKNIPVNWYMQAYARFWNGSTLQELAQLMQASARSLY